MTKVEEIHAAVDTAAETLLIDMPYDSARARSLQAIGFVKSENVQDYTDHQANHSHAVFYRNKYPHHKFITKHQLEKINKKYNLITGSLSSFKGSIPVKNANDMLNFMVFRDDIDPTGGEDEIRIWGNLSNFDEDYYSRLMGIPRFERISVGGRSSGRSHNLMDWREPFENKAEKLHRPEKSKMLSMTDIAEEFSNCCSITADRELFEQPARDLDPIVTVAVKGGFLIVTAWGTEASDPDVINQNMN